MQTVPEHRPSRNSEVSEEASAPDTVVASEKLTVVPKNRATVREAVFADKVFRTFVILCALAVLAIVGLIFFELVSQSRLSISKFGLSFLKKNRSGTRLPKISARCRSFMEPLFLHCSDW